MKSKLALAVAVMSLLAGCASVPMESADLSTSAKKFAPPAAGTAGLYIYRSGSFGAALKKDIRIDGRCIGESAANVFFYEEVPGDMDHRISTESEFSPNDLTIKTVTGKTYFVRQYMKMGLFVGGAGLELVEDEKGKKDVSELNLARKGTCSN